MELRQLEAFVAVAEERNFTRAATRLHVVQSGLSATIRSLERELHAQLFRRTTRQVELTPAGAALVSEARRTLASARAAAEAVSAVEGLQRGAVTVGIMQASTIFDLPGLLARYRQTYPRIELRLRHAASADLNRLLREHPLDLIFTTGSNDQQADVAALPLVESPLVVAGTPSSPLAARPTVDLSALADQPIVGYPTGFGVRALADQAFLSRGFEPRYAFEVNDTTTLLDLVEAGLGLAVVPEAIARLRPNLHRATIKGRAWTWTIAAETLAPVPPNPAARALWNLLVDTATRPPTRHTPGATT
jgi:DNA-binding transcriptional LysR family regulator